MTHMKPMGEHEGKFAGESEPAGNCPKCGSDRYTCRIWESNDGAYEDVKYECQACKFVRWVDGIDS